MFEREVIITVKDGVDVVKVAMAAEKKGLQVNVILGHLRLIDGSIKGLGKIRKLRKIEGVNSAERQQTMRPA